MSTYKSCWSWSVSQFSTCMSLLRHGCQRHSFLNSQTDSQMYTFPDQMNWQFVQILMDSKFHSKLRVLKTQMTQSKRLLCFLFRENLLGIVSRLLFFCSVTSSVPDTQNKCLNSHHNHPRPHLLHEFIVNVKHRMDWSYRKRYICLSFNSGKQYPSDGICLTSVNMQKYVTYLYDFFERVRFSLTYTEIPWLDKLSLMGKIINFPGIVTDVTH